MGPFIGGTANCACMGRNALYERLKIDNERDLVKVNDESPRGT